MTYTPSTDDVRSIYASHSYNDGSEFDRWLAAHDETLLEHHGYARRLDVQRIRADERRRIAEAIRAAVEESEGTADDWSAWWCGGMYRAARIAEEAE